MLPSESNHVKTVAEKTVGAILIVDDEQPICDVAREILEELDYDVAAVTSAADAISLVREHQGKYRLIILDLVMPAMDGEDLIRSIHALDKDARLIVSSGQESRIPAEELVRLGVVALMPKPYGVKELTRLARSALG